MDYQKVYNQLIARSQGRTKKRRGMPGYVYYERHHIVPRCMGGSNDKLNLIYLTPEEHWIAHLLLVKIYPTEPSLVYACQAMSMSNKNTPRTTNKLFGWIRRRYADEVSQRNSGRIVSAETREKTSKTLKGRPNIRQQGDGNVSKRPEVAKKISDRAKGRSWGNHSNESKQKISLANKGHKGLDKELNPSYKGEIIATPLEGGPEIRMKGCKEIKANGFCYSSVRSCIRGRNKIHKGYFFRQESVDTL